MHFCILQEALMIPKALEHNMYLVERIQTWCYNKIIVLLGSGDGRRGRRGININVPLSE